MNLKKVIAVALAAASLGCSCLFSASAETTTEYSKTINAKRGQVITAQMYVALDSSAPTTNSSGVQASIAYDNSIMKYTAETEAGTIDTDFTEGSWLCNSHPEGDDNLFLVNTMNWNPSGSGYDLSSEKLLAGVSFDVTTSGLATFTTNIEEIYANDDAVTDLIDYGKIDIHFLINGFELGDVTNDYSINILDAIMIQKRIVNTVQLTELQESLADTDGDGNISVLDAITVQKKVVNLIDAI